MKRLFGISIFVLSMVFSMFYFTEDALAISSIRDGSATHSNGYRASVNQSGNKTYARDVDPVVKKAWLNNKIAKGGKELSPRYTLDKGNLFVYDVYEWFRTQRLGGEDFFIFDGWSAIYMYHHHHEKNQATYIGVENTKTKERKIFKTLMTSGTADRDLHWNYGKAPRCKDSSFKQIDRVCNYDYQMTKFRAYIPLNELFEGGLENTWDFYIIKNVEGNLVYDELKIPFEHETVSWNDGKLILDSGINRSKLNIVYDNGVIKRSAPRVGHLGRFLQKYNPYNYRARSESGGVAVWYGVTDQPNTNRIVWTSSAFWRFGGDIAKLSWKKDRFTVTIKHVDSRTDTVLAIEKFVVDSGETKVFNPKPKGHFKDKDKNLYVPLDGSKTVKVKKDITLQFNYKASLPNPSDSFESKNTTKGLAIGKAYWELLRDDKTKQSNVHILNSFSIAGNHIATRKPMHTVRFGNEVIQQSREIRSLRNGLDVKGTNFDYSFGYEYTNYYRDIYKCDDGDRVDCFEWSFSERVPDWDYAEMFALSGRIKIDSNQKDMFVLESYEDLEQKRFIVGREDSWNPLKTSKAFYETLQRSSNNKQTSHTELLSQSTLPISPGELRYEVELPSGSHKTRNFHPLLKGLTHGYFFPVDVDSSLKEEYKNETEWVQYNKFVFPLQQKNMKDMGTTHNKRAFEFDYVTDVFSIGKHTGFISGYPYAKEVRMYFNENAELPSKANVFSLGESKLRKEYKENFHVDLVDEMLYDNPTKDFEKTQRYYIPVDGRSPLTPNTRYTNYYVIQDVGLNDVTLELGSSFEFEHYLFGSGADEAFYIEQKDSRVLVGESDHVHHVSIKYKDLNKFFDLKKEREEKKRIHHLRLPDRSFIQKVGGILKENKMP